MSAYEANKNNYLSKFSFCMTCKKQHVQNTFESVKLLLAFAANPVQTRMKLSNFNWEQIQQGNRQKRKTVLNFDYNL